MHSLLKGCHLCKTLIPLLVLELFFLYDSLKGTLNAPIRAFLFLSFKHQKLPSGPREKCSLACTCRQVETVQICNVDLQKNIFKLVVLFMYSPFPKVFVEFI